MVQTPQMVIILVWRFSGVGHGAFVSNEAAVESESDAEGALFELDMTWLIIVTGPSWYEKASLARLSVCAWEFLVLFGTWLILLAIGTLGLGQHDPSTFLLPLQSLRARLATSPFKSRDSDVTIKWPSIHVDMGSATQATGVVLGLSISPGVLDELSPLRSAGLRVPPQRRPRTPAALVCHLSHGHQFADEMATSDR